MERREKTTITILKSKEQQTRILLLLALFAASVLIFREYLFGEKMLVFQDIGNDTYQLYTMQFASVIEHLRAGNFAIWDFTNGFGFNQFNLNLFDPSQMLIFAIGYVLGPEKVLSSLVLVQILKILLAGWIFYQYLSCFSFGRQSKFAAAFAYGLNGYLLVWGQHYQFGMVTLYFPLMLLACENYLQRKKSGRLFPVTVFLCAIYSVYFSFMALAGVGVYLLLRCIMLENVSTRQRVRTFLHGCVQILLGLGMAMGIFLPMAECILKVSGRVGGDSEGLLGSFLRTIRQFQFGKYYQSLFLRLFSSTLQTTDGLRDGWFETLLNYYEDPVLFSGTLSLFLSAQTLVRFRKADVSRRKKIGVYLGAGLLLFSILLPVTGTILNSCAYYTGRFTFLVIPFSLVGMAWSWEDLREKGTVNVWLLGLMTLALWAACILGYKQSVYEEYRWNAMLLTGTGTLMAALLVGISLKSRHWIPSKSWLFAGLLALLIVNVVSEGNTNYEDRVVLRREDTPEETYSKEYDEAMAGMNSGDAYVLAESRLEVPQSYFRDLYESPVREMVKDLKEMDPELYRVEKDEISETTTLSMDSLAQGYRGVSSYNSVQNKYLIDFVDTVVPEVHFPDKNHYIFANVVGDSRLASFFGIRYLMSRRSDLAGSGYEAVKSYGDWTLYKNEYLADFARVYTQTISEESFRALCNEETREELLERAVAVEDGESISSIEELREKEPQEKEPQEKTEAKAAKTEEAATEQKTAQTSEQENEPTEALTPESRVIMPEPADDAHLTGTIEAASDGYVLFMIPYEGGWNLTIDGEKRKLEKGDLGFLACKVSEGTHEFQLTFEAPGFRLGCLLSAFFWILYLLLYLPGVVPLYLRNVRIK